MVTKTHGLPKQRGEESSNFLFSGFHLELTIENHSGGVPGLLTPPPCLRMPRCRGEIGFSVLGNQEPAGPANWEQQRVLRYPFPPGTPALSSLAVGLVLWVGVVGWQPQGLAGRAAGQAGDPAGGFWLRRLDAALVPCWFVAGVLDRGHRQRRRRAGLDFQLPNSVCESCFHARVPLVRSVVPGSLGSLDLSVLFSSGMCLAQLMPSPTLTSPQY